MKHLILITDDDRVFRIPVTEELSFPAGFDSIPKEDQLNRQTVIEQYIFDNIGNTEV